MKKKAITLLFALALVLCVPFAGTYDAAYAYTSMTQDQAIAWVRSQLGQPIDYDGAYDEQCVDLIKAYYNALGVSPVKGDGKDYATNALPDGWTRVPGGTPQKGDILVYSASSGNSHGHVAIYESDYSTYHQNFLGHRYVENITNNRYDCEYWDPYWGYIRPDWPNSNQPISGGSQTVSDGDYHIVSALDRSMGIDVYGGLSNDGTNIQLYKNTTDDKQVFTVKYLGDGFYSIIHKNTGKSLDVYNAGSANGTNLQLYTSNSTSAQKWVIEPSGDGNYFYIKANCNGLCIDAAGGASDNGTNIQMYGGNGSDAQKWAFVLVGSSRTIADGDYHIVSALDNAMGIDLYGNDSTDGTNVQLFSNAADKTQVFSVKYLDDGYYQIIHKGSGKSLDMYGGHTVAGTNLNLFTSNNTDAQKWVIRYAGSGYYSIISKGSGLCIDVEGGNAADYTNIQGYIDNGTNAQKWKFVCDHLLVKTAAKAATTTAEGNIDYWTCRSCGKYFKDSEGKNVIAKADTIIPKLEPASGSNDDDQKADDQQGSNKNSDSQQGDDKNSASQQGDDKNSNNQESGNKSDEPKDAEAQPTALPDNGPAQKDNGSTAVSPGAYEEEAEQAITNLPNDNDPAGAAFAPLMPKSTKQTKNSITLTWKKVTGAKKYVIYGNKCGKITKPKRLAKITGNKKTFRKVAGKKLKKGTYYKFMVVALDGNNKVISTSRIVHIATKGGNARNNTRITTKAKKNKITLRKGKTFKLGAKALGKNVRKHVGIRYESSNSKIAKVSKSGKITAKKKGTCKIYVFAQNGVCKTIKITVK